MPPRGHHGGGGHHHHGGGGVHIYRHHSPGHHNHNHHPHHNVHHNHYRHNNGGGAWVWGGGYGYGPRYNNNYYFGGWGGGYGNGQNLAVPYFYEFGVALCSTAKSECPSGCHQETCVITYYDDAQDDTVFYDCACGNGDCSSKVVTSDGSAQLAFGIIFLIYFGLGFLFVICGFHKTRTLVQQPDVEQPIPVEPVVANPMQPNTDLDTSRPFRLDTPSSGTNPQYAPLSQSPVGGDYPAASYPATSYPTTSYPTTSYPPTSYPAIVPFNPIGGMPAAVVAPSAPPAQHDQGVELPVIVEAYPVPDSRLHQ